jgi:acetyl-CoA C-acetyltransferase
MTDAVIVSTAQTPIGRAFRRAFNSTKSPTLAGHAIRHVVARAGIEPGDVEDVVLGTALPAGTAGCSIGRLATLAAGLPDEVPGQTIDRQCASGLMAIAIVAKQIVVDRMRIVVAGGQEIISTLNTPIAEWVDRQQDERLRAACPNAYMPMLQTAEIVAKKYGVTRDAQDEYALSSQQRTAAATAAAGP